MAPSEKDAQSPRAAALALMTEIVARLEEADPLVEWWLDVAILCNRFERLRVQLSPGDNSRQWVREVPAILIVQVNGPQDIERQLPVAVPFLEGLRRFFESTGEWSVSLIARDPEQFRFSDTTLKEKHRGFVPWQAGKEAHARALKTARQWLRAVERLPSGEAPAALPEQPEATAAKTTRAAKAGKGDQTAKIVAWLTKHHQYESGRVYSYNPAESSDIRDGAKVPASTVSTFLRTAFKGGKRPRDGYVQACQDRAILLHWFQRKHDDPMPQPNRKHLTHDPDSEAEHF